MTIRIKNSKLHTYNIYLPKLIFIFIVFLAASDLVSAMKNDKGWVIVIDAGHGGKDPGALGSMSRESDITLAIALKTGNILNRISRM